MKTYKEFKLNESQKVSMIFEGKLPSFNEFNKGSVDDEYIDDIMEAVGASSPKVRKSIERVHSIQLAIQDLEKSMIDTREKFLTIPKENTKDREPHRKNLIDLNHEKITLQKDLQRAEIEFERALNQESDVDDIDINLL